jgi:hypothetical protein
MRTKFSEFQDDEYKKVRNIILKYAKEETSNDSFSHYFKSDDYSENIEGLDHLLINRFNISLKSFVETYKDKIYDDDKFTKCCGFVDIILYRYDQTYNLGGNTVLYPQDYQSKYYYGYQNTWIGQQYLLQHFKSLSTFYNDLLQELLKDYTLLKDKNYKEIIEDVEKCTLLLTHEDNVDEFEILEDFTSTTVDEVFILILGDSRDTVRLKDDIDNGNVEEYLDIEGIKSDMILHRDANKYNL